MDTNEKFLDFKLITFFRAMILVLAVLMFFAPWLKSTEIWHLGTIGAATPPSLYTSGFEFFMGCAPIVNEYTYIQIQIVILTPILLLFSLLLMLKPKKEFIVASIAFSLLSILPIYHWVGEIQSLAITSNTAIHVSYGVYSIYLLIVASIFLAILTWRYCDMDEPQTLDSASDS